MNVAPYLLVAILVSLTTIGLSACNHPNKLATDTTATALVDVQQMITLGTLPMTTSLSGRVIATQTSKVYPKIDGVIDEMLFQEGGLVEAGQPLYRINADRYADAVISDELTLTQAQAAVDVSQANLLSQQAIYEQAQADLVRLDGLLEVNAISQQAYDQAKSSVEYSKIAIKQAQAALASNQATVDTKTFELSSSRTALKNTLILAPITGKTGSSLVKQGDWVLAQQPTALVHISPITPIYVDISLSSQTLLHLHQYLAKEQKDKSNIKVQLVLDDGAIYPLTGRLNLTNAIADETIGLVTLRSIFENDDGILIPNMFVTILFEQKIPNAALLPQSAIIHNEDGQTYVRIVNQNNQIELKKIHTIIVTHDGSFIVNGELRTGDKVVIASDTDIHPNNTVTMRPSAAQSPTKSNQASKKHSQKNPVTYLNKTHFIAHSTKSNNSYAL